MPSLAEALSQPMPGDSMADVMQRLRASAAPPVATPAPAAAPAPAVAGAAPPPQGVTGPVPAPATGDPGVATSVESGNRQFGQGDTPLIPPQFKGTPEEWNAPVGVTQVRPSTAFQYIPNVDFLRLQNDEGYNKQVGNAVHGMLFRQYAGNKMLADAAYYAGAATVDRLLKQVGDPRAGKISNEDFAAHLPPETRQYVHATGAVSGVSGDQTGAAMPDMPFPSQNIFRDMQEEMFGAKTEASEDLKGVRAAIEKLAEPPPQVQQTPPAQSWGSVAMAIAAVGGLLTHTPVTTGLNAAAGVQDAFNQGDRVRAKDEFDRWKAANDAMLKATELRISLYEQAMRRYAQAPETAKAELAANAAALNDQAMLGLVQQGDIQGALAYASGGAEALYKLKLTSLQYERATQVQLAAQDLQAARVRHDPPDVIAEKEQAYQMALQMASPAGTVLKIENPTGSQYAQDAMKGVVDARVATKEKELGRQLTKPERDQMVLDVANEQKTAAAAAGAAGRNSAAPKSGLSGPALDKAARFYHTTHQLPPGFGAQADKDAIENREAELYPDDGDAAERVAGYKADTTSLTQLTKQKDTAESYERSTKQELDLAVSLIPTTPEPLNSQLLTRWARTGETQFGDVRVPKYMTALISGLDEYAKVLSGGTGSVAASSDASRAQALSLIPSGATSEQIPAIVDVMKQGMGFKIDSYRQQIGMVQQRLRGGGGEADASQESLPAAAAAQLQVGHETTFANGQVWTKDADGQPRQVR
jgi:hypothetical protein